MKCINVILFIHFVFYLSLLFNVDVFASEVSDGPLVGGVTARSAKVFVRTDVPAIVQIQFSTSASMSRPLVTAEYTTKYSSDLTHIFTLDDLVTDKVYYYSVIVDGQPQHSSPFPHFKTFPKAGQATPFEFAITTDVGNFKKNSAPSFQTILSANPAFLLQIGDWDHRDPTTLYEMRKMHREVRGKDTYAGSDFDLHIAKAIPLFHVWDDHDYGMNDGDYTFFAKPQALKAYLEYYPTADNMPNPEAGIWQQFTYAHSEIYMLDVRSNRDPNDIVDDKDKSMLNGESIKNDQKAWLLNSLRNSSAKWKFITSGVPFNPTSKPSDGWGAFTTEWQEIVSFINQNKITGVIVLSGDLHSGGAIDDGTNSGLVEMSVPHTNMNMLLDHPTGVTTITPGTWSHGLLSGVSSAGFGWVRVETNPDKVVLEARGEYGDVRKSIEIFAE